MEDFLPTILIFLLIILVLLGGTSIYVLSLFLNLETAVYLVLSFLSLIIGIFIYTLADNIDNKDAIIAIKQVMLLVLIVNTLLISGNFFKIFAIF